MIADTACFSFLFPFSTFPFASPFLFLYISLFISLYLPFASPPRRGRALLCPPAKDHTPIALYILFYIYRILYITSYISHHINNINHRYRQSPKSRSGSTPGLSWRALSAVTVVSARSVCCLSEASFRRDSERRERSSEAGSALILWLLSDQAESNRKAML